MTYRIVLRNMQPLLVSAEILTQEHTRRKACYHIQNALLELSALPILVFTENVMDGSSRFVDKVVSHQTKRLGELDPNRLLNEVVAASCMISSSV